MYNIGARISEIIRLRVADLLVDRTFAVHLHGKGRKERVIPLWKSAVAHLHTGFEQIDRQPQAPVSPNGAGAPISRSGVENGHRDAITKASLRCPSLRSRTISSHTWPNARLKRSSACGSSSRGRVGSRSGSIRTLAPSGVYSQSYERRCSNVPSERLQSRFRIDGWGDHSGCEHVCRICADCY